MAALIFRMPQTSNGYEYMWVRPFHLQGRSKFCSTVRSGWLYAAQVTLHSSCSQTCFQVNWDDAFEQIGILDSLANLHVTMVLTYAPLVNLEICTCVVLSIYLKDNFFLNSISTCAVNSTTKRECSLFLQSQSWLDLDNTAFHPQIQLYKPTEENAFAQSKVQFISMKPYHQW